MKNYIKINNIQKEIDNLYSDNSIQREKLEKMSKKIDERLLKVSFKKISNKIKNQRIEDIKNKNNKNENSKLSAQEKHLENITNLIEIYKNDNKELRKKCENIGNINNRHKLIDQNKKYSYLINQLKKDITIKKKQLKEHSNCYKNREIYNKSLLDLKDELNQIKVKKDNLELKIKNLEIRCGKVEEYNKQIKEKEEKEKVENVKSGKKENNKISENENEKEEDEENEEKKDILNNLDISEEEFNFILQSMNNDKKKYDDFISKIIIDFKNIQSIKGRHLKEKTIKENKIEDLNNQINFFSQKTQEEKAQSKIYRSQIEEYNSNEKAYTQKDINFEGQRKKLSNEIINKEKTIKNLTKELDKFRNKNKKK